VRNICLIIILWLYANTALAFGATGHRVIGQIADNHLTAQARASVSELLGPTSLAEVSTWADEIRSDSRWDHASSWHWVTIEDGDTYQSSKKNPNGDLVVKLHEFMATLADKGAAKEDRIVALKWLVHLVGDVHQPLHVGRGADRGGNGIAAEWFGDPTNMHRVWDSEIIRSTRLSFSELSRFIDKASTAQVLKWQKSTIMDWVDEAVGLRNAVYTVPDSTYEYSYKNLPVVKQQLLKAGVRLSGVLNQSFR
jgi:hypothetical protein